MAWRDWKGNLGLSGVSPYETMAAKRLGHVFEWPMLSLAILVPFRWYFEFKGGLSPEWIYLLDWVIWGLFVLEAILVTWWCRDKIRYLRENWLNLVIIVAIFPPLWHFYSFPAVLRLIRLIVLVDVFIRMVKVIYRFLRRNHLGTTLMASAIIIVISGILVSVIDPAFESPFDGIWWSWVTVSTVGYGDLVPVTVAGRIFAIILILLGIGLFALLTAQISAVLIGQVGENIQSVEQEVERLETDEVSIKLRLERLEQRLERIEGLLENIAKTFPKKV